MGKRRSATRLLAGVLGAAALVALVAFSPRVLPYNMDEFVHYHALGCATAPLGQELPSYRDGCGLYDLRLPLTRLWLPLRSYYYIGSFPAAVFFPLWLLIDDPVAARVQGGLFFVAFILLAARLLGVRPALVLLASLVFPAFVLAFIVDQGPVALSALLLLVALLAMRRSLAAVQERSDLRHRLLGARGCAAVAGGTVFLGLWVKLIFGWWLPAIGLFALVALAKARRPDESFRGQARRLAPVLLAGGLALFVPTALLLASVDIDGRPYGSALTRGRISAEPAQVEAGAARLARYMTDASLLAPRNVALPSAPLDVMPAFLSGLLLLAGLARAHERRREIAGWALLGLVTFALASTSAFTQWPHHFAFPVLFLVLALAVSLQVGCRVVMCAAAALVLVLWVSLALRWPDATFPRDSSAGKDELLAFVRTRGLDREMLQVHSSWGTYYIAQLFGDPERMAVFVKGIPDDPRQLREVSCLARERGRPVLLISARDWSRLQSPHVDEILGRPSRTWRFGEWWAVAYDTGDVECGSTDPAAGGVS